MRGPAVPVAVLAVALVAPVLAPAALGSQAAPSIPVPEPGASPGRAAAGTLRQIAHEEGLDIGPAGPCPDLRSTLSDHADRLGRPVPDVPDLDPRVATAAACLLAGVHEANVAHDATFEGVPTDEKLAYVRGDRHLAGAADLVEDKSHDRLLRAAIHQADRIDRATDLLTAAKADGAGIPSVDLPPFLSIDATGPTLRTDNYAVTIDLAGDDIYDNHAGGIWAAVGLGIKDQEPANNSIHQQVLGADVHVGGNVQDADLVLTSSIVLDTAGDDTYGVEHPPKLQDARQDCTDEPLVPWVATIGAGILGVGQLYDLAGNDTFVGRTQTQGAGHILGVGVLYGGPGDDTYRAIRAAQGSGLLGGIGLLLDPSGDDEHRLEMPEGGVWNGDLLTCDVGTRYAQGSAFDRRAGPLLPSVGILVDDAGRDTYEGQRLVQGFGQGPGLGLLLDRGGDDRYTAEARAQGASQGRSADRNPQAPWGGGLAALVDRGGDDTYEAGDDAQGWSMGNDPTDLPDPDLVAILLWARDRNEAAGALLDAGGSDLYTRPGRADGEVHAEGVLGLFVDG